jgi:uncharacterized protein YndB with AHSA1/START domain
MVTSTTDRIERTVQLRSPIARVWRALSDSAEFGTWFQARIEGQFAPGARLKGKSTHPGCENMAMELQIERMEVEQLFSFRWQPTSGDATRDSSKDPTTLVEFRLKQTAEGTQLTVTESGFDRLPEALRADALRRNDGGWAFQMENIARHVQAD